MPGIGAVIRIAERARVRAGDRRTRGATRRLHRARAGECYEYHYGGGGGWGDPLDRPAERVLGDVLDEYVSIESARRDYGVVLTGDLWELTLAVDIEATAKLRAEMRTARRA